MSSYCYNRWYIITNIIINILFFIMTVVIVIIMKRKQYWLTPLTFIHVLAYATNSSFSLQPWTFIRWLRNMYASFFMLSKDVKGIVEMSRGVFHLKDKENCRHFIAHVKFWFGVNYQFDIVFLILAFLSSVNLLNSHAAYRIHGWFNVMFYLHIYITCILSRYGVQDGCGRWTGIAYSF